VRGRKAELKAIDGGLKGVPPLGEVVPVEFTDEWNAICIDMIERKILNAPALGMLETYLIARWTVREAQKAIQQHGALVECAHKALKPNPASGLLSKALESVARLSAELGISPASRSKRGFNPKGGKPDEGAPADLDL
jgi:P27 family predicted phage terminase small subunit